MVRVVDKRSFILFYCWLQNPKLEEFGRNSLNQPTQEYLLKISLVLKLRQSYGESFQSFFSNVMGKLHGDDYVCVRASGSLGDKGCDGYLNSLGQVYQCYGAINGSKDKVSTLIGKMKTDFIKAKDSAKSHCQLKLNNASRHFNNIFFKIQVLHSLSEFFEMAVSPYDS